MITDELKPEDIPVFSLTTTVNTKEFISALNAVLIAAKSQNYNAIFMVVNPGIEQSGVALVGGNERNIVFINVYKEVNRNETMVSFAFNPSKISSMINGLEDETCTLTLDADTENLTIKDSTTKYTLVRTGLDTKWVGRILALQYKGNNEDPITFTLDNDMLDDLNILASSNFGENIEDKSNKVYLLLSNKKIAYVKNTSKVVSVIKHSTVSNIEDGANMTISFNASHIKSIINPFVNYKSGINTVSIFSNYIRISKNDDTAFCMIPRTVDHSTPFGLIKRLTKYSNETGRLICDKIQIDKLSKKISAVLQDSSIATRLEYSNHKITVEHNTSSSSVQTTIDNVNHIFFNREGANATSKAENVSISISSVSIQRLTEIIKYFVSLSRRKLNRKDPITMRLYKGGYVLGRDPEVDSADYLLLGDDNDEYVLISCNNKVVSENIPTFIPVLIE